MSRAFTSEKGGDWFFCRKKRDTCTYADEYGQCMFSYCRVERERQAEAERRKEDGEES